MKNITLFGNCGKKPELRTTQSGTKVCSFSLAVNDGFGENKNTLWFDVTFWGKRGETISERVNKGDKLVVTGDLSTDEYEGKTYLTVNGDNFSFAGGRGSSSNQSGRSDNQSSGGYDQSPEGYNSDIDEDLPF